MTEFQGAVPALQKALDNRGYESLTPVQSAVLNPEFAERDLLVSAQTGSGKTVAFGLAIAPTLLKGKDKIAYSPSPIALAIAPTRELALQVKRELEWLYAETGAKIASCVGGMDMRTERRALEGGAHIVVGTPGRLRDHIERRSLDLSNLKAAVLDEADEMLDLGFKEELEFILGESPKDRRTLLFSATVPRSIATLASKYQNDAVRVETSAEKKQHLDIEYKAMLIAPNDTENAIINVLRFYEAKNAIVFCNTRATVNHMTSRFSNRGFSVVALSGELSQKERSHALQAMRDGRAQVCIATDVAARGIDLPNLELVIHADLPKQKETLLHRSGRTGRAGRKGVSALIVPSRAKNRTERLLKSAQIKADWCSPPSVDEVLARDNERFLDDPILKETLGDAEREFAERLLENHSAEQLAGALVRLYRKDRSAPEELRDAAAPPERTKRGRNDFANSVWFSLSIGRKQSAEPRWMLPMIIKNSGISKADIGAIRIMPSITYVELTPKAADRFVDAVAPSMKLEKTITVTKLDIVPEVVQNEPEDRKRKGSKPRRDRSQKPHGRDAKPASKPSGKPRKKKKLSDKDLSASARRKRPKNKGNAKKS